VIGDTLYFRASEKGITVSLTQDPNNSWQQMQAVLSIIGGLGGILGAWALLRTYWTSRPRLVVTQKSDAGYNFVERRGETDGLLISLLVSNTSTHSNSILRYAAEADLRDGRSRPLEVLQGTTTIRANDQVLAHHDVNVVPLNVPALSTAEVFLDFLIQANDFTHPLNATVTAMDMHGNEYTVRCSIPNPLAIRF
jgi:hypothetical protein